MTNFIFHDFLIEGKNTCFLLFLTSLQGNQVLLEATSTPTILCHFAPYMIRNKTMYPFRITFLVSWERSIIMKCFHQNRHCILIDLQINSDQNVLGHQNHPLETIWIAPGVSLEHISTDSHVKKVESMPHHLSIVILRLIGFLDLLLISLIFFEVS